MFQIAVTEFIYINVLFQYNVAPFTHIHTYYMKHTVHWDTLRYLPYLDFTLGYEEDTKCNDTFIMAAEAR